MALEYYLTLAAILFLIGLIGILTRRSIIIMMISIEMMLNSVNLTFVSFNRFKFTESIDGVTYSFFIIAIAAAEVAVGLSILIAVYRRKKTLLIDEIATMKH
jgi:NADH-quinone oxidoreductase subunit K